MSIIINQVKASFSKLGNLMRSIKTNGGIRGAIESTFWTDDLREQYLVGTDKFGNKYYENNNYYVGRNRIVHYSPTFRWSRDGSQVPAEWHRWLHQMTDTPPSVAPPRQRKWFAEHQENKTGTDQEYIPYSTAKPKIQAWKPGAN